MLVVISPSSVPVLKECRNLLYQVWFANYCTLIGILSFVFSVSFSVKILCLIKFPSIDVRRFGSLVFILYFMNYTITKAFMIFVGI